jgi:hypothetical protein
MKSDFQTGNGKDTHILKKDVHRFSEKYGPDSDLLALLHASMKCVPTQQDSRQSDGLRFVQICTNAHLLGIVKKIIGLG